MCRAAPSPAAFEVDVALEFSSLPEANAVTRNLKFKLQIKSGGRGRPPCITFLHHSRGSYIFNT